MTDAYILLTSKVEIIEKKNNDLEKKVEELQHLGEQAVALKAKSKDKDSFEAPSYSSHVSTKSVSTCEMLVTAEQSLLHTGNNNSIDYENHTTTSAVSVKAIEDKIFELERNNQFLQDQLNSCNTKAYVDQVIQYEEALAAYKTYVSELVQLQTFTCLPNYNGAYLWPISEIKQKVSNAKSGCNTFIQSPPFYTGRNGYKMCIRAYLNGDGSGEGTHLSIFFVLMKGEYDALLQWPFESEVSLILVDQDHKRHIIYSLKPNPLSNGFQRPKTDMNVANGVPEFIDLSFLDNTSYVKDDTIYIKAIVDTSKIFHP